MRKSVGVSNKGVGFFRFSNNQPNAPGLAPKVAAPPLRFWARCYFRRHAAAARRKDLMKESELRDQSRQFLSLLRSATRNGNLTDTSRPEWAPVREFIAEISRSRASQGFNPSETATFIFSLRAPLLELLIKQPDGAADVRAATVLMDKLGLHTVE